MTNIYKKNFKNTSVWNTEDLIEIVERCAEFRGVDLDDRLRERTTKSRYGSVNTLKPFRVGHSDGKSCYRGRCYARHLGGHESSCSKYNTGDIFIGVPNGKKYENFVSEETQEREFNKERFAQVVLHEIDHLLGLAHKDMMDSSELETPDFSDIEVRKKEE